MPDLDHLPRGMRRGWRRVADAVRGRQDAPVVADAMEKAIAKTVRLIRPDLGWLVGLDQAIGQAQQSGTLDPLNALISSLDARITRGVEAAFVDEARRLAATNAPHDLRTLLVGGLRRMPEKLCLAAIEPELMGTTFTSYLQLRAYKETALARVNAGAIADGILRNNLRTNVRAPRTSLVRRGTKGLLHAPIKQPAR